MSQTTCESCAHYVYDELYDCYYCTLHLDEDEMQRFLSSRSSSCPYWRSGDDYAMVRKQN